MGLSTDEQRIKLQFGTTLCEGLRVEPKAGNGTGCDKYSSSPLTQSEPGTAASLTLQGEVSDSFFLSLLILVCMCAAGKPAKAAVGKALSSKGSAAPARSSAASARPASKGKDPAAEKRAQQLAQEAEVSHLYDELCC